MLSTDLQQVESWRSLRRRIAAADGPATAALLADQARLTRRSIVEMIAAAGQGHIGGDLSVTDVLTVLYDAVLRIDPSDPGKAGRDRFILSKGHCAASLYTTLARSGYFPPRELGTFLAPFSPLGGHPDRTKVPGVETNTGPLGHGLPVAVGQALAARLTTSGARIFVVMGDGEMQEGSNWEALMAASQYGLDNLVAIVDRNRLQQGARTEETNGLDPLDDKLEAFGCEVRIVDGHDHLALIGAFRPAEQGKPVAVIANTVKGKGVSFMENRVEWHHKVPSNEQVEQAIQELTQK